MSEKPETVVTGACEANGNDPGRMMDIVRDVQQQLGCVDDAAMDLIAAKVGVPRVEVASTVTFYSFLSTSAKGGIVIRLCDDIIDKFQGVDEIAAVLTEELGIGFGETTPDGKITLEWTACIGMSDQAPAAMINDEVFTNLSTDVARKLVRELVGGIDPRKLVCTLGDGANASELVHSMVRNNIRKAGPVVLADSTPGEGLAKALAMTPAEVIRDVKTARLRGRGGAGFPTGMKWDFTRGAEGTQRYVVCNADEGEPGTFKDRVILTEKADLLFEGMTIAGYAIGSDTGILYLRAEYAYLRKLLESILTARREAGLLGENVAGKAGFNYDIRIQMGAGAYICGEETSLLSSCEGKRGDPKNRPPFPAQKGYMGCPTTVNNVETFCCVARILENGPGWFAQLGSTGSPGTKLLSICGDCHSPGVYEVPFGTTLAEVLRMAGADDPGAVQVGGPSGQLVGPDKFEKTICYDDLATGGSIMIFNSKRDVLAIAEAFMEFFIDESCGYCTPCRAGNVLLNERLKRIRAGKGEPADLEYLQALGENVKLTSRCGLGQTSPNPILSTLANFPGVYETLVKPSEGGLQRSFDIQAALGVSKAITGRESVVFKQTERAVE